MIKETYNIGVNDRINLEIRCSLPHHVQHILAVNVMGFSRDGRTLYFKYDAETGANSCYIIQENDIVSINKRT